MDNNTRIAKELVKIAESLMDDEDLSINEDVKKILPSIKDESVREEIVSWFSSKRKVAGYIADYNFDPDWNEQVRRIKMWNKQGIVGVESISILLKALYEKETNQKLQPFFVKMLTEFLS